jgi:hypothetical protein
VPARCGRAPASRALLDRFWLPLSCVHRRDRDPLAVGFIVRWLVAEKDIGNAGLPPDIVNVRHGEAAGVIWPHDVMLAVQRIVLNLCRDR